MKAILCLVKLLYLRDIRIIIIQVFQLTNSVGSSSCKFRIINLIYWNFMKLIDYFCINENVHKNNMQFVEVNVTY